MAALGMSSSVNRKRSATKQQTTFGDDYDNEDDDYPEQVTKFEWSNVIFIPFNEVFMLVLLISVIHKTIMGPLTSITPELHCMVVRNDTPITILTTLKQFNGMADTVCFIDTFLHIVHKQVEEKARQREHLPKSSLTILLDIFALIPFYRLVAPEECSESTLWPHILAFHEFIIIYRVFDFFSLGVKHSVINNLTGAFVIGTISLNAMSCLWLLLTYHGFCKECKRKLLDWRTVINKVVKDLRTNEERYFYEYFSVFAYFASILLQTCLNDIRPMLILEMLMVNYVTAGFYFFLAFVVIPKLFAESCLRNRQEIRFQRHVTRVLLDANRRNPNSKDVAVVVKYYHLIWIKKNGITRCPKIIRQLPRYLSTEIQEDLCWPIFFHSPILRRVSVPFKRWICDFVNFEYKMPGELFFKDTACYGNIFYIKSGIVQLMSSDDSVTPLLSVTGGTIFGDINFYIPALHRKILVRCLTYCEVYTIERKSIYMAMSRFLKDRDMIMYKVQLRIQHAKDLYALKKRFSVIDRSEDENIYWLKMRWWKIFNVVNYARKKASTLSDIVSFEIPFEETIYHCSKYIGQLVLCSETQLQNKSTFVTARFPWILVPDSSFSVMWRRVVRITVFVVLIIYPPTMIYKEPEFWFPIFDSWVTFVYIIDIVLRLVTAPPSKSEVTSFSVVMFTRCKDFEFLLDIFATPIMDELVQLSGLSFYEKMFKFNRLVKIYTIFKTPPAMKSNFKTDPIVLMIWRKALTYFSFLYISCFFMFIACFKFHSLSHLTFFCYEPVEDGDHNALDIFIAGVKENAIFLSCQPKKYNEIFVMIILAAICFIIKTHNKSNMIAALYMKYVEYVKYQFFVSQLMKKYETFKINRTLATRLAKYLECHWTAYDGMDLRVNEMVHSEAHDVYWRCHGDTATKIIRQSEVFLGCSNEDMIKELAYRSKFVIYPKNSVLYLFGCPFDKVAWLVNGHLSCESFDQRGKIVAQRLPKGEMVSVIAVFFGKLSVRTFIAVTDVEILYMKIGQFHEVMKRYPQELTIFRTCIRDLQPAYEKLYNRQIEEKTQELQNRVRHRLIEKDVTLLHHYKVVADGQNNKTLKFFILNRFWIHPQSRTYQRFVFFRLICVFVSIIASSIQAGSAAFASRPLWAICMFNDGVTYCDMILKLFLAYYDKRGLLIYSWRKRFFYYFTHTFIADLISSVPWYIITNYLIPKAMNQSQAHFFNTVYRFASIYLINGYFNYMAFWPSANLTYLLIAKWCLILVLIIMTAAQFYAILCIDITWTNGYVKSIVFTNETCWISNKAFRPSLEGRNLTFSEVREIYAESILIATHCFLKTALGRFQYRHSKSYFLIAITSSVGIIYWYVMTYIIALLVLNSRGLSVFLDSIKQLENFLKGERIEAEFIDSVTEHYKYVWFRTKGITIQTRAMAGLGSILRQDLSYFFFKGTLGMLESQLHMGRSLKWILAFYCDPLYFLEGADIMRENDIVGHVYIIHRGAVTIFQNNKRVATIEKGSIFGQLVSCRRRPVKVTATARDNTDILAIPWNKFHEVLTNQAKINISKERTAIQDYIAVTVTTQDPSTAIGYLLRKSKTISYPWMKNKTCNIKTSVWFSNWLILAWLIIPLLSIYFSVVMVLEVPYEVREALIYILAIVDTAFFIQLVSDYLYGLDLIAKEGLTPRFKRNLLGKLKNWGLYNDIISLLIPLASIYFQLWWLQLVRLLRIRLFFLFYQQFISTYQSHTKPTILYFLCVILSIHVFCCMYIYFTCQHLDGHSYIKVYPLSEIRKNLDALEWTTREHRKSGCSVLIRTRTANVTHLFSVRTKHWYGDYLVALSFIVQIVTMFVFIPDLGYYKHESTLLIKAFINIALCTVDILILSKAISVIYVKYRQLYKYSKTVTMFLTFLMSEGLSPTLQVIVKTYMKQLWQRQRGNWLPELAHQAPQCLREDIMGTLYIHHLQKPRIFHEIPSYFLRQLVSRFHRVVIFPGKYIVRVGDVLPRLYFIHEGDVEKHYVNTRGEVVTTHLLTTNGYFGFIPGMPKDMAFSCSYYTRTVVDMVYIQLEEWRDLLDVYEEVKTYLYTAAESITNEL